MKILGQQGRQGFTIAELLVVIVVIGILASIALVVYPGYQTRTKNNERKSDVSQIAAALGTYAIQKNSYMGTGSGCGAGGNGNGWVGAGPTEIASYPKSILTCLQQIGTLGEGTFIDPSGCLWASGGTCGSTAGLVKAYMKASCTKGGVKVNYIFAYLETEPQKVAEVDALCDSNSVAGFDATSQKWGTNYGMNYYVTAR